MAALIVAGICLGSVAIVSVVGAAVGAKLMTRDSKQKDEPQENDIITKLHSRIEEKEKELHDFKEEFKRQNEVTQKSKLELEKKFDERHTKEKKKTDEMQRKLLAKEKEFSDLNEALTAQNEVINNAKIELENKLQEQRQNEVQRIDEMQLQLQAREKELRDLTKALARQVEEMNNAKIEYKNKLDEQSKNQMKKDEEFRNQLDKKERDLEDLKEELKQTSISVEMNRNEIKKNEASINANANITHQNKREIENLYNDIRRLNRFLWLGMPIAFLVGLIAVFVVWSLNSSLPLGPLGLPYIPKDSENIPQIDYK